MFKPDLHDVSLLFGRLVVLPGDAKSEASEVNITPTDIDTTNNKQDRPQQHPFIVLTTPELAPALRSESSNFSKTIEALDIRQTAKYVVSHEGDIILTQYESIWCIGLSDDDAQHIMAAHPNVLVSPNIENLKTKEEKLAMWNPLKTFVQKNQKILAKIA